MKVLTLIIFAFAFAIAAEKYGVYDLLGNRISTFEAEPYNLPEKAQQFKAMQPNKNLYISSLSKGKSSKPSSRYRYEAETGAYIEVSRKETFSICPDKEIQGTWISEYSVALDEKNCFSVQAPNLAGTIRILFVENSGHTDTIQVLVEQSYIQMGDYMHKIWVDDTPSRQCDPNYGSTICEPEAYGHYENKKYEQALIVDKTEFTVGDAWHYSKFGIEFNRWILDPNPPEGYIVFTAPEGLIMPEFTKAYPPNEDLKTSMRPYLDSHSEWKFANIRSKLEGLDTVYRYIQNEDGNTYTEFTLDTNASGYRLPYKYEWGMLMRAGASTRYYWGDEEDSLTVSRYTQVRPVGYAQHKVAQKQPNAFGLYDMISPNNTNVVSGTVCAYRGASSGIRYQMQECRFLAREIARQVENGIEARFIKMNEVFNESSEPKKYEKWLTSNFDVTSTRFIRKTPKLHKLDKF